MRVTLASKIEFKKLCDTLEEISAARGAKKAEILERFFDLCRNEGRKLQAESSDADISLFPILRVLLPQLERERGPHNLKEKTLANLYIRVFRLGNASSDAKKLLNYKAPTSPGTDFAETAFWVLRNCFSCEGAGITIERINLFFDDITKKNENNAQLKDKAFNMLCREANALQFKWITRIILKDLKLGIGIERMLQAFHPDANASYNQSTNLREICDQLHDPRIRHQRGIKIFSHFKPMLLERLKIEDVAKLFTDGEPYYVQLKYDGERSQVHIKDGRYKYFTRQGFDITNNAGYGETSNSGFLSRVFGRLLNPNCSSIILDGELMGWHKLKKQFGSKGMNFDVKKLSEKSAHQPCFVAFDIIMYNDTLLDGNPYKKRLDFLKTAFTEEEGTLMMGKWIEIRNSEELLEAFNESMKKKEEGLVLKKYNAIYKPNMRDGSGCYKIKAEYSKDLVEDVDLIILGGYYGEGKCTGLIKSFLMGVASPTNVENQNPSEFFSVVSVSNGLSQEMLKYLSEIFKKQGVNQCPANVKPPRLDQPNLWLPLENSTILTVRATEMTRSKDYPLGFSLRFPRVTDVRTDKPWYSVCTTTQLLSLVKDTGPIQKLTKREVKYDDIEEAPDIKLPRMTRSRLTKIETDLFDKAPVVPLTRLFDGKEICVINGDSDYPKERIEEILLQHRAKVVQNPLKTNYCIIIGNVKTARAQNILQSSKFDVVTLDWFKHVTKEENWGSLQDFLPWDLLCARKSTKDRLAKNYDDYYDSFTLDADIESLRRSSDRVKELAITIEFDRYQAKKLDQKLFENAIGPYSLFRDIVGYFDDRTDSSIQEFRFMAGKINETIDETVTHVFINGNFSSVLRNIVESRTEGSLKVVGSGWIRECFQRQEILPIADYIYQ